MKTPQNVLTVSPDTSREMATPLIDGCNNNQMVHSTNSLSFSCSRRFQLCKTSL